MSLRNICHEQFFPANPRIQSDKTIKHYERALTRLGEVVGREPEPEDLTDDNLRKVLAASMKRGTKPSTANTHRDYLVSVWNWCARRRIVDDWPTVAPLPEPIRIPKAWSHEQLDALIKSCKQARGMIGDVLARDWWLAFHAVAWDTGERTTAILSLRWEWLDISRGLLFVPAEARKGKRKDAMYQVMPDTLAAIERIRPRRRRPLVFHGLGSASSFWKRYETILKRAGLPTDRSCKPQKIRRSHASHLKAAGGDPTASLMHSSDAITRQSYLDPSICEQPHAAKLFRILPSATDNSKEVR